MAWAATRLVSATATSWTSGQFWNACRYDCAMAPAPTRPKQTGLLVMCFDILAERLHALTDGIGNVLDVFVGVEFVPGEDQNVFESFPGHRELGLVVVDGFGAGQIEGIAAVAEGATLLEDLTHE